MLNLQPYENPQYFVYLIIALLPVIIGMFKGFGCTGTRVFSQSFFW